MIATILFGTSGATPGVAGENVSLPKQTQIESNPTKGAQINGQTFVRRGSGPATTPSVGSINGTAVRQKRN